MVMCLLTWLHVPTCPWQEADLERLVSSITACSLHYLDLFGSALSDQGLQHLQRLPHLTKVRCSNGWVPAHVLWACCVGQLSSTLLVQERTERCSLSRLQNAESSGFLCLPGFAENCSAYAYTFTRSSSWHAWICAACACPPPLQVCLGVSTSIEREGHTLEGVQGLARVMAGRGKPALIVAHMLMDSEVSEGLTARSAGCSSPKVVAL